MNDKLYRVGLYIRLSVEDKHYGESTSVENQRAMLGAFVSRIPNWIETRTYVEMIISSLIQCPTKKSTEHCL
jgi:hypothetical protein